MIDWFDFILGGATAVVVFGAGFLLAVWLLPNPLGSMRGGYDDDR